MNLWVLFAIVLQSDSYVTSPLGFFTSMDECFKARSEFMITAPQPKINYEAICIQTDRIKMQ